MRISRRADYALRAVLDLALYPAARRGSRSSDVARRTGVPEKFLEAVLRDLREAGLVSSRRGPEGGHRLALDPERITVSAVLEAIDGPLSPRPARLHAEETPAQACVLALWRRIDDAVSGILRTVTVDDLRRQAGGGEVLDFNI